MRVDSILAQLEQRLLSNIPGLTDTARENQNASSQSGQSEETERGRAYSRAEAHFSALEERLINFLTAGKADPVSLDSPTVAEPAVDLRETCQEKVSPPRQSGGVPDWFARRPRQPVFRCPEGRTLMFWCDERDMAAFWISPATKYHKLELQKASAVKVEDGTRTNTDYISLAALRASHDGRWTIGPMALSSGRTPPVTGRYFSNVLDQIEDDDAAEAFSFILIHYRTELQRASHLAFVVPDRAVVGLKRWLVGVERYGRLARVSKALKGAKVRPPDHPYWAQKRGPSADSEEPEALLVERPVWKKSGLPQVREMCRLVFGDEERPNGEASTSSVCLFNKGNDGFACQELGFTQSPPPEARALDSRTSPLATFRSGLAWVGVGPRPDPLSAYRRRLSKRIEQRDRLEDLIEELRRAQETKAAKQTRLQKTASRLGTVLGRLTGD